MPSTAPISLAARERLRDHQATATKAVTVHSAALTRLDAATSRRAEVVAKQDALVATAAAEVSAAVAEVVRAMGTDVAATVLGLSKAEVQRTVKETK